MKKQIIQIYEIRTVKAARQIADLDIDHVGLWASSQTQSTALSLTEAKKVFDELPVSIKKVVLNFSDDLDEISKIVNVVDPDILHIGSRPQHFSLELTRKVKARFPHLALMRSIPVGSPDDIALARSYDGVADFLLLDTYDKSADNFGATGKPHNWDISRQIVQAVQIPVILAGGLGPENVVQAISKVNPAGVDSKSNTDIPGTHDKDLEKLRRFVENVRQLF